MGDELRGAIAALLPRLRRFAAALAGSDAAGDRLVQAACMRVLGGAGDFPLGARLDAWLYRIIRVCWSDQTEPPAAPRVAPQPLARRDIPPTLDAVRRELAAMPEDDRALLLLVCAEGFTYQEAADALGIPIGAVTSRLARARLALLDDADAPTAAWRSP